MQEIKAYRKVGLACDDSPQALRMVHIAASQVLRSPDDEVHILSVFVPPVPSTLLPPMAPMASAALVASIKQGNQEATNAELQKCHSVVQAVQELLIAQYQVPNDKIRTHVLLSQGGASGVSEALIHFASENKLDWLALGDRGMGAIKRSLMSMVGLGSVSDAVLRKAAVPVLLVRWDPSHPMAHVTEATPSPMGPAGKRVCVAYDGSAAAGRALGWALQDVLRPEDTVYLVCVMLMVPTMVFDAPGAVYASVSTEETLEHATRDAQRALDHALRIAVTRGFPRQHISTSVLPPGSGSNPVGDALATFAKEQNVDVVVVGARGLGAVERGLMSFLGLGSVSEYLAHHLKCAMAVLPNAAEHAPAPAPAASDSDPGHVTGPHTATPA